MSRGRVLGLDPGERRIGVALSDATGIIAQPHMVIDRRRQDLAATLRTLYEEHEVGTVVVGLPVSLSGEEGASARRARAFGAKVEDILGCQVVYQDERFTTVQAEDALLEAGMRRVERREKRDKIAAALMLQAYLDAGRGEETP
jgi:putative Holliday junction resolvase